MVKLFEEVMWKVGVRRRKKLLSELKMTGGTPEVRSVKINLIDFWHLTFDLIDFLTLTFDLIDFCFLTFDIQLMDQWTNEPMDQWTNGLIDQRTNGPMDKKLLRLYENKNTLENLKYWNIGTFEHLNIGTLDHWNIGTLEHYTFNRHQFASCDINCIDTVQVT